MVIFDVLESVIDEVIEKEVDLIIVYYFFIFRFFKYILIDQFVGRLIEKCLKYDIVVYVVYINLDIVDGGVNDLFVEVLELIEMEVLVFIYIDFLKKLVVYVLKEYEEQVRIVFGNVGVGYIGEYSYCVFLFEGIGSFKLLDGVKFFIGEVGEFEFVYEVRLEIVFFKSIEKVVINVMIKSYLYEEVVYDIYFVEQVFVEKGFGCVGIFKNEMMFKEFVLFVKDKFEVNGVRMVGEVDSVVKKVVFLGGDGNKYIY